MNYIQFLERIIDDGIAAAKSDYTDPKDIHRLEGSIAGFEACRNKISSELLEVYKDSCEYVNNAFIERDDIDKYWWFNCYRLEVEWVCNVVSAAIMNEGWGNPILPHLPTVRGVMKANDILSKSFNL